MAVWRKERADYGRKGNVHRQRAGELGAMERGGEAWRLCGVYGQAIRTAVGASAEQVLGGECEGEVKRALTTLG